MRGAIPGPAPQREPTPSQPPTIAEDGKITCPNCKAEWYTTQFCELKAENERLKKLETRVFEFVAMGEPITVEAFSDLARPDTAEDVARRASPSTSSMGKR